MNRRIIGQNREFKGIWIPAKWWLCEDLKVNEIVFLAEIDSLNLGNGCFASNAYFSDFFGLSKVRCSQIINSLKSKGYVSIEMIQNESGEIEKRIIRVVNKFNEGDKYTKGGIKKSLRGYKEKFKDNNTINNTINNINNNNVNKISEPEIITQKHKKRVYEHDDIYYKISMYLVKTIQKNFTTFQVPKESSMQKWSDDARKLVELDKRSLQSVKDLIDWVGNDNFWSQNILSVAKLRKQFETLNIKREAKAKEINRPSNQFQKEQLPEWAKDDYVIENKKSDMSSDEQKLLKDRLSKFKKKEI